MCAELVLEYVRGVGTHKHAGGARHGYVSQHFTHISTVRVRTAMSTSQANKVLKNSRHTSKHSPLSAGCSGLKKITVVYGAGAAFHRVAA